MSAWRSEDLLGAARVAAGLTAAAAVIALLVRLTAVAEVRDALQFSFPGVPNRLGDAAAIFLNNARVLVAVLAACLARRTADGFAGPAGRLVGLACDLVLLVGCGFQVLVLGAALGAYGGRALWSIAAHGPFELAAFSLALALYLEARRGPVTPRRVVTVAAIALACLAAGALLEAYA